jgi:hypothetical protein
MAAQMDVQAVQAAVVLSIAARQVVVTLEVIRQLRVKMAVQAAEHSQARAAEDILVQEQIHLIQALAVVAVVERLIQSAGHQ